MKSKNTSSLAVIIKSYTNTCMCVRLNADDFASFIEFFEPRFQITLNYNIILKRVTTMTTTTTSIWMSNPKWHKIQIERKWKKKRAKRYHRIIPINRRITFFAHVIIISTSCRKQISLYLCIVYMHIVQDVYVARVLKWMRASVLCTKCNLNQNQGK